MSQRDKPQLALNNITAGVREREDANRTRVVGHLDEIQGVVANKLDLFRNGAVGFIDWLDSISFATHRSNESGKVILPFLSNPKVTPDEPPCPSEANPA